jgi:hypothetical protein
MNTLSLAPLTTALVALVRTLLAYFGVYPRLHQYGVRAFSGAVETLGFDTRASAEAYGRQHFGSNYLTFDYSHSAPGDVMITSGQAHTAYMSDIL